MNLPHVWVVLNSDNEIEQIRSSPESAWMALFIEQHPGFDMLKTIQAVSKNYEAIVFEAQSSGYRCLEVSLTPISL